MTRNGKIARMPYGIREALNRRLRDGKSGPAVLKWLNEQEECLEVLDDEFESRPITKQNLSEWKQGGYMDWVRKEETRERVHVLMEKADDLERDAGRATIGDRVATLLEVELAVAMEQLDEIKDPKERCTRVKEITRELSRLRREDHHARKLRMEEEQYERREKKAETKRLLKLQRDMQDKQLVTSIRGGGDEAWKWTDWEIRVRHGLPMPLWWKNPKSAEDWSELMSPYWWEEVAKAKEQSAKEAPRTKLQTHPSAECGIGKGGSGAVRASRSKSDAVRPRPTGSGQKSDAVRRSPGKSKSVECEGKGKAAGRKGESSKFQVPNSKKAPNPKLQERGTGESDVQVRESREIGAPLVAENIADESGSTVEANGKEMEDTAKTGPASPSDGEPDKSNPSGLNVIKPSADGKANGGYQDVD